CQRVASKPMFAPDSELFVLGFDFFCFALAMPRKLYLRVREEPATPRTKRGAAVPRAGSGTSCRVVRLLRRDLTGRAISDPAPRSIGPAGRSRRGSRRAAHAPEEDTGFGTR